MLLELGEQLRPLLLDLPDALRADRFGALGQLLLDHGDLLDRGSQPHAQVRARGQFLLDLGQPPLERGADVARGERAGDVLQPEPRAAQRRDPLQPREVAQPVEPVASSTNA